MFLQETPPDTSAYMIAGYALFFLIGAIYLLSLFVRRGNLERDLKTLESLQSESRQAPAKAARKAPAKRRPAPRKAGRRK